MNILPLNLYSEEKPLQAMLIHDSLSPLPDYSKEKRTNGTSGQTSNTL